MDESFEVTFMNQGYSKRYPKGTNLLDIIRKENIPLSFACGGGGTCGKCLVRIPGTLTKPTVAEENHISQEDLVKGYRLACQTILTEPLKLEIEEEKSSQIILQKGLLEIDQVDPLWGNLIIERPEILSWQNIASKLENPFIPTIGTLQKMAQLEKQSLRHSKLRLEYFQNRIIDIDRWENRQSRIHDKLGVAVDVGTTTLAAYIVNLHSGRILKTASAYNPQTQYGADIITRIQYASTPEGLERLHQLIISAINQLLLELVKGEETGLQEIIQLNLVGNSCMAYILMNINPEGLGRVPFEPVFKQMLEFDPIELGISLHPQARAFLFPGIGGFIGADISAGVLACRLSPGRKELFIDIGTNCEMVLSGYGKMVGCSTAAGPAFEGATIDCGMLAKPGAITDIALKTETIVLTTIHEESPAGICGTGLIRIMVEFLKKGIIDASGSFIKQVHHPLYDRDAQRFYMVRDSSRSIYISQQDIRQFQLAKGAIRCGIELMLKRLGLSAGQLETIYLAGAFGTYLDPEDAIYLGLLPAVAARKIRTVGNTAGTGAVLGLISQTALNDLRNRVQDIEHIELADDPEFTEKFMEALRFGSSSMEE